MPTVPEAVRDREPSVEVLEVREVAQRGHLVDHDLGVGARDGLLDLGAIKAVHDHRLRPEFVKPAGPDRHAGCGDDRMPRFGEEGDEATADCAGATCHEDSH